MKIIYCFLVAIFFISCSEIEELISSSEDGEVTIYASDKPIVHKVEKPKEVKRFFIEPENGGLNNPFLLAFVENLKKVVRKRDTTAFFAMLDPNVISGNATFNKGIEAFKQYWQLDQPEKAKHFWSLLGKQLELGGVTEEQNGRYYYCIPYTSSNKAFSVFDYDFDWYHTGVCIKEKSIVYEEPNETSIKVGTLNYDIVEFDPNFGKGTFCKIKTIDQRFSGYVKTHDLAFTDDPHLEIVEVESEYKIVAYTKQE
ncbi:MAG: hypothetical protein MH472_05035 [Bacteroidia bacterium]|nr:hypothetical protein [Bacteroidia bacterium]